MKTSSSRIYAALLIVFSLTNLTSAQVPFSITGPGVDPNDFVMTEFATGLNYPVGMVELDDGSVLVATSNGSSFFGSSTGSLVRLADFNNDGVADLTQTLVNDVPAGILTALRRSGDLIFVTGQSQPMAIYRLGAEPYDPLTLEGTLDITYPTDWSHDHSALAIRPTPGVPGSHDMFFQVGSRANNAATVDTVPLTSTIGSSGNLAGDAVHMIQITDLGTSITGGAPVQIATGLRNAAGLAFHPTTGDLYIQDNGIDGLTDSSEAHSADEINVIAAADIGGAIENFGFPTTYVEYRTDIKIGLTGIDPIVAFQPIPAPNGAEAEGPNDIAFAPASFPAALQNGLFVGFHGQFSSGGVANEENPVAFVDLDDNSYFHFIENDEASVGHIDGLMATNDSLFLADISPSGGFGATANETGTIYRISTDFDSYALGDINRDDSLDQTDIDLLVAGWKSDTTGLTAEQKTMLGDINQNGITDFDDVYLMRQSFIDEGVPLTGILLSIPEPTSAMIAMCLGMGWLVRRRGM